MTLYYVMHHVTAVMCLFMVQEKKNVSVQVHYDMWHKFQVNYQTEEWYMIANVFKYRSVDLIMLYWYSGLLNTVGVVI